jgi:3-oxoadipate enol-lactonase
VYKWSLSGPEGKPVVVLANALGTTSFLWDGQLAALESSFRVLRYEYPGHDGVTAGEVPFEIGGLADELLRRLDDLFIDTVSLCGASLGSLVGMAVALRAPSRVQRLILSSAAPYFDPAVWHDRAKAVKSHGLSSIADAVTQRWFTPIYQERCPDMLARFRRSLVLTSNRSYVSACQAIAKWNILDQLDGIAAPTLVVVGAEDRVTPPDSAEMMAKLLPDAKLLVLEESAHLANVEQADHFNVALLEHLLPIRRSW